ncbi:MAG TPA: hypothetical protein ENL20_03670 [Candidatus Cloacimonetes bacterium]|nr:hypothetical protein [Candidatus Cloacimonadota bacterium]
MKKLLLLVLILSISLLNALKLGDFSAEKQNIIKDYLIDRIELDAGETIESVEGEKYNIMDFTDDYWIVVDKDGNIHLIPIE